MRLALALLVVLGLAAPALAYEEATVSLTAATSATVAPARASRQFLLLQTVGSGDSTCCFQTCPCVAGSGLLLRTPGGTVILGEGEAPNTLVCCISTPGSSVYRLESYR